MAALGRCGPDDAGGAIARSARACVGAAGAAGAEHDLSFSIDSVLKRSAQQGSFGFIDRLRLLQVPIQFHPGARLVDVLPARAAAAGGLVGDFVKEEFGIHGISLVRCRNGGKFILIKIVHQHGCGNLVLLETCCKQLPGIGPEQLTPVNIQVF